LAFQVISVDELLLCKRKIGVSNFIIFK